MEVSGLPSGHQTPSQSISDLLQLPLLGSLYRFAASVACCFRQKRNGAAAALVRLHGQPVAACGPTAPGFPFGDRTE